MVEYQDILKLLADNPPCSQREKTIHALLLEMLAKKLREKEAVASVEALNAKPKFLNLNKKYH